MTVADFGQVIELTRAVLAVNPDVATAWNIRSVLVPKYNCHSSRVLARIKLKCPKKHVATTMTRSLGEIFLVKCQKQAFSFNKREAKVYCYAFLHVLKRDTCIKHEKLLCISACFEERYMHKT
jgi:hypothetical protein